ncbi:PRD domain-containing protein [Limosilactobacillus caecicola]|uniref:PRD domain-containing protein n=1 Tax=Limosilactobacillus caecicola TaxID=2941332 RepID=UPI00204267C4|nr:PRD domain-containing protein [Limosilactobacillus caecicola]
MIDFTNIKHGNELLTILCNKVEKFTDSQSLADKLLISRRSLFYVIKKVNSVLDKNGLEPVAYVRNIGYLLPDSTIHVLKKQFLEPQHVTKLNIRLLKTPSSYDRQIIDIYLMISDHHPVISSMQSLYSVSKSTILNDIRNIKKNLPSGLSMVNTDLGKEIAGDEMAKRRWVLSNLSIIYELIDLTKLKQNYKYITEQLKGFEQITGSTLSGNAFNSLLHFLSWYLFRVSDEQHQLPNDQKPNTAYTSLSSVWASRFLMATGISRTSEINYLSTIINSNQFNYIGHDNPMMEKLRPIAKAIVHQWELSTNSKLTEDTDKLTENLTIHLVPTYYRCRYKIQYHNPLLKEITTNYRETFQMTKLCVAPLEKFIHTKLSDDEISLISIYFGSALRNEKKTPHQKGVMVVCSSGIGTSRMLFRQLKNVYPAVNFIRPFNTLELENVNWSDVAGIISTLPINTRKDVPAIQIQALPTKADWHTIRCFLVKIHMIDEGAEPRINVESLIDVIAEYARIEEPHQLKAALNDFLLSAESIKIPYPNREHFLGIDSHYIQIFSTPTTWIDAIENSFKPLEQSGATQHAYTKKIIEQTTKHGDYMVIGNGIMLAHGAPNDGVNHFGIGFNVFKEPFQSVGGKQINIVITLAPVDSQLQVPFLEVILKYASDKNWLTRIMATSSKKELESVLATGHLLSN